MARHDGSVVINARCRIQRQGGYHVVTVAGLALAYFGCGDRVGRAYAMVTLVEQGLAGQVEVAAGFDCSERTVRRNCRRFESGGPSALGRPVGYPKGAPRLGGTRISLVNKWKSEGISNREIACRLGVTEREVRKLVRRLGWRTSADHMSLGLEFAATGADPNLSGFETPSEAAPAHEAQVPGEGAAAGADPNLSSSPIDLLPHSLDNDPSDRTYPRPIRSGMHRRHLRVGQRIARRPRIPEFTAQNRGPRFTMRAHQRVQHSLPWLLPEPSILHQASACQQPRLPRSENLLPFPHTNWTFVNQGRSGGLDSRDIGGRMSMNRSGLVYSASEFLVRAGLRVDGDDEAEVYFARSMPDLECRRRIHPSHGPFVLVSSRERRIRAQRVGMVPWCLLLRISVQLQRSGLLGRVNATDYYTGRNDRCPVTPSVDRKIRIHGAPAIDQAVHKSHRARTVLWREGERHPINAIALGPTIPHPGFIAMVRTRR